VAARALLDRIGFAGQDLRRSRQCALRDAIIAETDWDYRTSPVDYDRHVALADKSVLARVNASNPGISPFVREGGTLILSGGWNNVLVPAGAYTGRASTDDAEQLPLG
jgi:hypothetical protein